MNAARHWRRSSRQLLLLGTLLLLSLRLMAPQGFMPQWHPGGFALIFCDGVAAAPAEHHGHHGGQEEQDEAAPVCPYAVAAGHSFDGPPRPVAIAAGAEHATAAAPVESRRLPVYNRVERPRSRGPPLSA